MLHRKLSGDCSLIKLSRSVCLPVSMVMMVLVSFVNSEAGIHPTKSSMRGKQIYKDSPSIIEHPASSGLFEYSTTGQTNEHISSRLNNGASHVAIMEWNKQQQQLLQQPARSDLKSDGQASQFSHVNQNGGEERGKVHELNLQEIHEDEGTINSDSGSNNKTDYAELQLKANLSLDVQDTLKGKDERVPDNNNYGERLKHQVMERRFGFFKKGQQNNMPFYNLPQSSQFNECDRCLANGGGFGYPSQSNALAAPAWISQQNLPPFQGSNTRYKQLYNPLRHKLEKFSKFAPMDDSYYPHGWPSSRGYRFSLAERRPAMKGAPLNCASADLLQNNIGQYGGSVPMAQGSMEDPEVAPPISYMNTQM